MIAVSSMQAKWLVRRYCAQFVDECPAVESGVEYLGRARRTQAALSAGVGALVNPVFLQEAFRLFGELREVHAGTHEAIEQNAALTVNNVPALVEHLHTQINAAITDLLAHTEPLPRRAEDKVLV